MTRAKARGISRRRALQWLGGTIAAPSILAQETRNERRVTPFAPVAPGYRMRFPQDEGSHPEFRLEWWYVTGWLDAATRPLGFQVTFFRARPDLKQDNPSAFTPRQIMIAHAALSDPAQGRLVHAQRAAREGFALAGADTDRTHVWIDGWRLQQDRRTYRATIQAGDFSFDFALDAVQPHLLQGDNGLSRKGPAPESASYYYSIPHLKVSGLLTRDGKPQRVTGSAWLDHEWSSQYMEQDATSWDWIGINLFDGAALMAFRMRDKHGGSFWAGGALRRADGAVRAFTPEEVTFVPGRAWRSVRTGASYPVTWTVRAGDVELAIEPLFDDQEHDTRATSGTIYWEGAVRALRGGQPVGKGYLELTGYWRRLNL
jgi:predicted secreted hydrolase